MREFELINTYFSDRGPKRKDVVLGVGDDAALLRVPEDKLFVVATDTIVENVHFFPDTSARSVGHRCLAINLSDFAAMGAEPAWASVALTLPKVDEQWIKEFTQGLFDVADYFNVQIIGGDTTQGPLAVTVSLKGYVSEGKAMLRSGAKVGDWIYVTGELGASALAVKSKLDDLSLSEAATTQVFKKFDFPKARIAAGQVIHHVASSAIDISDGLIQDLQHILNSSQVGAEIHIDKLPIEMAVKESVSESEAIELALMGGEDYELIFTLSESEKRFLEQNAAAMGVKTTCIGQIKSGESIKLLKENEPYPMPDISGYQHFS